TAAKKKGKYVYYRCTGYHGPCGNSYIREEQLARLLGTIIAPIQISTEVADDIETALRSTAAEDERRQQEATHRLEQRRQSIVAKLDRGYDDYVSGKISEEF